AGAELHGLPALGLLAEHALHLLGEDDAHGLEAQGAEGGERGAQVLVAGVGEEVLGEIGRGAGEVLAEDLAGLPAEVEIDAGDEEAGGDLEERRALHQVDLAVALDQAGPGERGEEPGAGLADDLEDL